MDYNINFKVNGVEVEFDFMDMDEKERFDDIFLDAHKKISDLEKKNPQLDTKFGRGYCEIVLEMIEELFGEEKAFEIFDGKCNVIKSTTALKDLTKAKLEQDKAFEETLESLKTINQEVFEVEESKLNREQRRNRKKYKA